MELLFNILSFKPLVSGAWFEAICETHPTPLVELSTKNVYLSKSTFTELNIYSSTSTALKNVLKLKEKLTK